MRARVFWEKCTPDFFLRFGSFWDLSPCSGEGKGIYGLLFEIAPPNSLIRAIADICLKPVNTMLQGEKLTTCKKKTYNCLHGNFYGCMFVA